MEKALIEKWRKHQMDAVDEEMFKARLRVVQDKMLSAMRAIYECTENNEDELAIMGIKIIFYVDSIHEKSPVGACKLLAGPKEDMLEWAEDIKDKCKE